MDEEMYDDDEAMGDDNNRSRNRSRAGGNRLNDPAEIDDEPALQGYERYVS